mmetsp:Transcript_1343/g.6004  ORF Transcript_1343/g.6004 Transcript_1343/m.6004 type:complete len:238 (-) Transcript_1343:149-862(-)
MTWSVPEATFVTLDPSVPSGVYTTIGVRTTCSSTVNAHKPELLRKAPHATIAPESVATATCESPVDTSMAAALFGIVTRPGLVSAPSTSFLACLPSAPSSLTPHEYRSPPWHTASVCMPPHTIFSTVLVPPGMVLSSFGRVSSMLNRSIISSPRPSWPASPQPKTKTEPPSLAPAACSEFCRSRSLLSETSAKSSLSFFECLRYELTSISNTFDGSRAILRRRSSRNIAFRCSLCFL